MYIVSLSSVGSLRKSCLQSRCPIRSAMLRLRCRLRLSCAVQGAQERQSTQVRGRWIARRWWHVVECARTTRRDR